MIRTAIASLCLALAFALWWFAFDSRAPAHADDSIPLASLRQALATDDPERLPIAVELHRVGTGIAPMLAVQTGGGFGKFAMAYTAFGVRYRNSHVMIDAAADRETTLAIGDKGSARFEDKAYALLLQRIATADQIVLTHEHRDHVMAVSRHPALASLARSLRFPESQRAGLMSHAGSQARRSILRRLPAMRLRSAMRIAPGIAVAPVAGHSPGSLLILVRLARGREYLFIGDIAWSYDNIETLRTRPRFLQWLMFDPNEDRVAVLRQLRALHDIHRREPGLVIVPSHDNAFLDETLAKGEIRVDVLP